MKVIMVGYGNLAKAIVPYVIRRAKAIGINTIEVAGRDSDKINAFLDLCRELDDCGLEFKSNASAEIDVACAILLLCIKPYAIKDFVFKNRAKVLISFMAGLSERFKKEPRDANPSNEKSRGVERVIDAVRDIRAELHCFAMPNIAAEIGQSATAVYAEHVFSMGEEEDHTHVSSLYRSFDDRIPAGYRLYKGRLIRKYSSLKDPMEEQIQKCGITDIKVHDQILCRKLARELISSFSTCVEVDTLDKLQASVAVSGSAIAVLALVVQGVINSGVCCGLSHNESKELTNQTLKGLAEMLNKYTPQEIKDMVTSPSGTTARALLHCDLNSVQGRITEALNRAVGCS